MEVLEGIPHPRWEPKARSLELTQRKTTKLAEEIFYEQLLPSSEEFRAQMTAAFAGNELFIRPLIGALPHVKACGGFHADYGVSWWQDEERLVSALICFGCHDIQLVGKTEILLTGMTAEGLAFLEKNLRHLRVLRPPFRQSEKVRALQPADFKPEPLKKIELKP